MKLMGFSFTKISAEKKSSKVDKLKIENNIDIGEISEIKSSPLVSKDSLLNFKFSYELDYTPKFASLMFEGNMILSFSEEESKEILKNWKGKKLDEDLKLTLFNLVLRKCNVKALGLEEDLNLPTHFRMPSIQVGNKK